MIVHQAYFGDMEGSHNVIASSLIDRELIGFLKLNTDIPASITIEEPYFSGIGYNDWYILTKTINDPTSERRGMGFSHCLIFKKTDLAWLSDLLSVRKYFLEQPVKRSDKLLSLEIESTHPQAVVERPDSFLVFISALANSHTTVVYLGTCELDGNIQSLWALLSQDQRCTFSFTISGSPNEIEAGEYTMVYSPEKLEVRWAGFPIVKPGLNQDIPDNLPSYLLDSESVEAAGFYSFLGENDFEFIHINQYNHLATTYRLFKEVSVTPAPVPLKKLLGHLSRLLPERAKGGALKSSIFSKFLAAIEPFTPEHILLLRNMDFSGFIGAIEQLDVFLGNWARKYFSNPSKMDAGATVTLIRNLFDSQNPQWWRTPIMQQFEGFCQVVDPGISAMIWQLWIADSNLIEYFSLPETVESVLFDQKITVRNPALYSALAVVCRQKQWLRLHAFSASHAMPPKEAVLSQLSLDNGDNIGIVKEEIGGEAFLEQCLSIEDDRLIHAAALTCIDEPFLLQQLDIRSYRWQQIGYEVLVISGDYTPFDRSVESFVYALIDQSINGRCYVPLLEKLSFRHNTIFQYSRRKEAWNKLIGPARANLLEGTSRSIVAGIRNVHWSEIEEPVKTFIHSHGFINSLVEGDWVRPAVKIETLKILGCLSDTLMKQLLQHECNSLNYFEAELVGKEILAGGFRNSLSYIVNNYGKRPFFSDIAQICRDMLGLWDRIWVGKVPAPVNKENLKHAIDRQELEKVFSTLQNLGINDKNFNRLREEYIAGVKGIELNDLCNRLKTYLDSLS